MRKPTICKSCGHVEWDDDSRMKQVYDLVPEGSYEITSCEVAGQLGITTANASSYLAELWRLGLVWRFETAHLTGGKVYEYSRNPALVS